MAELLVDDADGVRTFTFNRPESFNAFTIALKESFLDALRETSADASVRAVVITGAGRAFCARVRAGAAAREVTRKSRRFIRGGCLVERSYELLRAVIYNTQSFVNTSHSH